MTVWSHNAAQEESFCPGTIIRLAISLFFCIRALLKSLFLWSPRRARLQTIVQLGTSYKAHYREKIEDRWETVRNMWGRWGKKGRWQQKSGGQQMLVSFAESEMIWKVLIRAFLLLMFLNACGMIMIGYYVDFQRQVQFQCSICFWQLHANSKFPGSGQFPLTIHSSQSSPITPEQWTHKHSDTSVSNIFNGAPCGIQTFTLAKVHSTSLDRNERKTPATKCCDWVFLAWNYSQQDMIKSTERENKEKKNWEC